MPLGMEVDLGPGDIVLDGDPFPHPTSKKGAQHPQFWPMYCGQTAAWIRMPFTGVSLGPGDIVLHGNPARQKGHSPQFSAHVYTLGHKKEPTYFCL